MNTRVRRRFQMGAGVQTFGRKHPVDSPEFILIMAELDGTLERIVALDGQQRAGLLDRHAAALRIRELTGAIRSLHLPHLAEAGQRAARTEHELATVFRIKPAGESQAALRTAVATMVAEAEQHLDVMLKAGLSAAVLSDLKQALAELDAAQQLARDARAAHVGASAELTALGDEVVRQVRLLSAVMQLAYRRSPELLAAWRSVSRVRATPATAAGESGDGEGGSTPSVSGGDVRPAA